MLLHDRAVNRAQLAPGGVQTGTGGKAAEHFRHAVFAACHHGRRQVVGACYNVCDEFGFGWIGIRGFEDTNDRCTAGAESNRFTENGRVSFQPRHPKTIRQHGNTCSGGTIVGCAQQSSQDGPETHHLEIITSYNAGTDLARLPQPNHREGNRGKFAQCGHRLHSLPQILNFRDRKRRVLNANAWRTLTNVDKAAFVPVG